MKRVAVITCALAIALAACSSSSSHRAALVPTSAPVPTTNATPASEPSQACSRPHASGQSAQSFTFQGQTRTYQLYVPPAYDGTRAVPLVFDFHGFGSNAVQQMAYGNFKPEANRDNFLIVAPDGQGSGAGRHFNLSGENGLQNDLQMVDALLAHIESQFCVDTKRVYSTGMSDGGAMTSVLACTQSDKFAAFAPVAVIINSPACGDDHPIALLGIAGTADPVVPFNGGKVRCCGGSTVKGAPDAMAGWAAHDQCAPAYTDTRLGSEVRRRTWSGCRPKSEPVFYIVDGGGHTWPGSIPIARLGMTTKQLDASATIWDFFKQHPLVS